MTEDDTTELAMYARLIDDIGIGLLSLQRSLKVCTEGIRYLAQKLEDDLSD